MNFQAISSIFKNINKGMIILKFLLKGEKMPCKKIRKIYKIGSKKYKTPVISIPKDWLNYNDVKEVELFYNSVILIIPPNIDEKKRKKFIEMLK